MAVKFDIDTRQFENALLKYKLACKKSWQFVISQQARLVAQKLVEYTPPKSQNKGNKNVATDIGKVFADLGNTKWNDKSLDKMWRAGNFDGVKLALQKHPNKDSLPIFNYDRIFKEPIRNIHKAAIGSKGRVPKNWRTRYAVGSRGALNKYIKAVQKNVGIARSGWLAGLSKLGGKAPSWVSRHGTKYGSFVDKNSGDNPYIDIINNVKTFPKGQLPINIMNRAVKAQTFAMENNVKRIMKENFK